MFKYAQIYNKQPIKPTTLNNKTTRCTINFFWQIPISLIFRNIAPVKVSAFIGKTVCFFSVNQKQSFYLSFVHYTRFFTELLKINAGVLFNCNFLPTIGFNRLANLSKAHLGMRTPPFLSRFITKAFLIPNKSISLVPVKVFGYFAAQLYGVYLILWQ